MNINLMILNDYIKLRGVVGMNIGILDGDYVTIIDDRRVLTGDGLLHKVNPKKVLDTKYHIGQIVQIVPSRNIYCHHYEEGEDIILLGVTPHNSIRTFGTKLQDHQSISLEDIGFYLPSKKPPLQWLDLQGESVKVGDTVMFLTGKVIGERGVVKNLDKDFTEKPMIQSGIYHKYMENVLKINSMLPPHVTMETNLNQPKTIYVSLWNKEHTRVIKTAKATCSNSDTFSFEFGLYGVAIPRLFGRDIRQ